MIIPTEKKSLVSGSLPAAAEQSFKIKGAATKNHIIVSPTKLYSFDLDFRKCDNTEIVQSQ